MTIALVAAMDAAGLIGVGGRLPWHLPADLAHFRALTEGYPVVMGRKTFESIGSPLTGRTNLVLTRGSTAGMPGCYVARTLKRPLRELGRDVFVIGGAQVFAEALPLADVLHLTRIRHAFPAGDGAVYFPRWAPSAWCLTASEERAADAGNPYPMTFEAWRRR